MKIIKDYESRPHEEEAIILSIIINAVPDCKFGEFGARLPYTKAKDRQALGNFLAYLSNTRMKEAKK